MPYIEKDTRRGIDRSIEELAMRMGKEPGVVNYAICSLLLLIYKEPRKYADYNEIIGVLESAKLELFRSFVGPYEDKKKEENGDL